MNTILIATVFSISLFFGFAALVHFARADRFAGPGTAHRDRDELGALVQGRRSA